MVPAIFPATICSLTAIAAPSAATPSRLCPHPCPGAPASSAAFTGSAFWEIPGSASYSPRTAMTGAPWPYSAMNAVGISATPLRTRKPCFSANAAIASADFVSSSAVSA